MRRAVNMNKEIKLLIAIFSVSLCGAGVANFVYTRVTSSSSSRDVLLPPKFLAVPESQILREERKSPENYILVEFLDYQCPPCRGNKDKIKDILTLYGPKLQFVVRQFPLKMHPNALSAAAASEAAREQDKLAPMHDALLSGKDLRDDEIRNISLNLSLNASRFEKKWKKEGMERVIKDQKLAEALGIDGTPSFLICTPQGKVWRLGNIDQIHDIIGGNK
jgi:protein-disulfide isomerase